MFSHHCLFSVIGLVFHVALARNLRFASLNSEPKDFSMTQRTTVPDPGCPRAEYIAPCTCQYPFQIDCSDNNTTDADLARIFSQPFPAVNYQLNIDTYKSKITELGDILVNGIKLIELSIRSNTLERISSNFLINSTDTLGSIRLISMRINETTFPFKTLGNYTKLFMLEFYNNYFIHHLPLIEAPALIALNMEGNTGLKSLSTGFNKLIPKAQDVFLAENGIQRVEKDAFTIQPINTTPVYPYFIDLSYNQIEYLDPQAFVFPNATPATPFHLNLRRNRLNMTLEEAAWRPMLDRTTVNSTIDFGDEPPMIQCQNCSMAWLFDPSNQPNPYLAKISGSCQEGMSIRMLTPDWYEKHCQNQI